MAVVVALDDEKLPARPRSALASQVAEVYLAWKRSQRPDLALSIRVKPANDKTLSERRAAAAGGG
jgi:hypothetical protein